MRSTISGAATVFRAFTKGSKKYKTSLILSQKEINWFHVALQSYPNGIPVLETLQRKDFVVEGQISYLV